MYEIYYPSRTDWGEIIWIKWRSPSFFKRFDTAKKRCDKLGKHAYIHKYGNKRAIYTSFTK